MEKAGRINWIRNDGVQIPFAENVYICSLVSGNVCTIYYINANDWKNSEDAKNYASFPSCIISGYRKPKGTHRVIDQGQFVIIY